MCTVETGSRLGAVAVALQQGAGSCGVWQSLNLVRAEWIAAGDQRTPLSIRRRSLVLFVRNPPQPGRGQEPCGCDDHPSVSLRKAGAGWRATRVIPEGLPARSVAAAGAGWVALLATSFSTDSPASDSGNAMLDTRVEGERRRRRRDAP